MIKGFTLYPDQMFSAGLFCGSITTPTYTLLSRRCSGASMLTKYNHFNIMIFLFFVVAVFMETIETPNLLIVDRIYAHQIFTRVLITEITVTRKQAAKGSFTLKLTGNQGNASIDLEMLEERSYNGNDDSIL